MAIIRIFSFALILTLFSCVQIDNFGVAAVSHKNNLHSSQICSGDSSDVPPGFHFVPEPDGLTRLGIIGDVNDVLQGRITSSAKENIWSVRSTGPFGFGAGAIGSLSGLGEAIFVNEIAFVRSTDNGSENYFQTIADEKFKTPFSLFVLPDAKPNGVLQFSSPKGTNISFLDIYERIYRYVGNNPYCFYGLVNFAQLDAVAVSKAPIYNEPLFGEIGEGYYSQGSFQIPNLFGFIFGCAANFSSVRNESLRETLEKLLYLNPMDIGAENELHVHSHVLSLNRCVLHSKDIRRGDGEDVFHLLSNSTVNFIQASIFQLEGNESLKELKHPGNGATFFMKLNGSLFQESVSMITSVVTIILVHRISVI